MHDHLIHVWNAPTPEARDPRPGSVVLADRLGRAAADSRVDRIFQTAQQSSRLLEDEEIETLVRDGRAPTS